MYIVYNMINSYCRSWYTQRVTSNDGCLYTTRAKGVVRVDRSFIAKIKKNVNVVVCTTLYLPTGQFAIRRPSARKIKKNTIFN